MVGHLAFTAKIFGASELIGKDAANQILGRHACQLRWNLVATPETGYRQRYARDPAPAGDEHRRIEQRLNQDMLDTGGMEVARNFGQLKAVRRRQRKDDAVLCRRRLQLEIEFAAEALAQSQAPCAIDATAVG